MAHLLILALFFFPAEAFPKQVGQVLKDQAIVDSPRYAHCVKQFMNHPFNYTFSFEKIGGPWNNTVKLQELHDYCSCQSRAHASQVQQYNENSLAYFFSGRESFLSDLDICLQENVKSEHYHFYYSVLTFELLKPFVSERISEHYSSGWQKFVGRMPAQDHESCATEKLFRECHKVNSLYFTYLCLKKRFKDIGFMDQMVKECPLNDFYTEDLENDLI